MAARDTFHQAVKTALTKDQWQITADPLLLQVGGVDMYVDLGAEKLLAAEKDQQLIAVEVKSFLSPSPISDFHLALGQFLNYRLALAQQDPQRRLYLAVPIETYAAHVQKPCMLFGVPHRGAKGEVACTLVGHEPRMQPSSRCRLFNLPYRAISLRCSYMTPSSRRWPNG